VWRDFLTKVEITKEEKLFLFTFIFGDSASHDATDFYPNVSKASTEGMILQVWNSFGRVLRDIWRNKSARWKSLAGERLVVSARCLHRVSPVRQSLLEAGDAKGSSARKPRWSERTGFSVEL